MRNFRYLICLAALLIATFSSISISAEKIQITKNGEALFPIIISENASQNLKDLAGELAFYLKSITGAEFEIKTGRGNNGIVIGTIQQFPDNRIAPKLKIYNTYDGKEAYAIKSEKNRLLLIGATESGTSHAIFRFLEILGCRWYFPAKEWEIIPKIPNISTNIEEYDRPAFLSRRIWYGYGFFDRHKQKPVNDYLAWVRHNRMGGSINVSFGHAWQTIISNNQKVFDEHPEYLALVGGTRKGPQICVSNPEVRKIVITYALNYFKNHPDADMVSVEPSDGLGHCECENCLKMGSVSERVFYLANEVAKAVAKEYPGKCVGLYAYSDHSEPPSFKLEPNVWIQRTAGFTIGKYSSEELMKLWPKYCQNMGYYEYLSVYLWDWDMIPGGRGANVSYLKTQIPVYYKNKGKTLDCESGNNWGVHGRGYYVASKLMWNPNSDVKKILDDFYKKAFGPAANVMKNYYERLDPGNTPLKSENLIGESLEDLNRASILAKNNADVQARINHLKQYMHYVRLWWDYTHTVDRNEKKEIALNVLKWVYRTRYSYMNHWEAMHQYLAPKLAKDFNEPSWTSFYADSKTPKPWADETPVTHEETEKLFQEDIKRFPVVKIKEVKFSDDLVPGGFTSSNPSGTSQSYQGAVTYAMYSKKGEPIECTITTGTIPWYRDRKPAEYILTDRKGNEISRQQLPLDGNQHPIKISVPKPGLYFLKVDDSSAGFRITTNPDVPCVIVQKKGVSLHHAGHMQTMYFYIPKGTKEIQYFIDNSTPHEVYGPDGKLIQKVVGDDIFITIPVPDGLDGTVWSIRYLALGQIWFFNIPSYLAASPGALLIPREIAVKDGLLSKEK